MRYHNITTDDMNNGEGLRTVLWVSGCSHHCDGCHNPITWNPEDGLPFDEAAEKELFTKLSQKHISGVTFSGGDPLHPANRETIFRLAKSIKRCLPNKTIWLYTGYLWEDVKDLDGLAYIDVLVEGKFEKDLADVNYKWAGSTNQRVLTLK